MKRPLSILILLACAGCTFDEPLEYNPELRLMFQPGMYMQVAHDDVERFSTEETFGVCAWELPEGDSWSTGSSTAIQYLPLTEAHSKEVFITDTTLHETAKDTLWVINEDIYWPDAISNLTFMAYAPYSAPGGCNAQDGITYTINMLTDQTDLLYTPPHADKQKIRDGWVVQLRFEHALCEVNFRVKHRVAADEKITIKRITLDELYHEGDFCSLPNPHWKLTGSKAPLTLYEGEHEATPRPNDIGLCRLVLPQKLDTRVTVAYDFTTAANTTISQCLQTVPMHTTLEPGRSYTFTLSVGIDDVKFLEEIIEDRLNTRKQ